jgi:DNA-binding LytR/AlgR family response regulator
VRVTVNTIPEKAEESAVISIHSMTAGVRNAISLLQDGDPTITGIKDGETYPVSVYGIYYAESVDDKSFIYTKNECYEVKYRLYELEGILDGRFIRISKSMICNIRKIRSVKNAANSRMTATLLNGETIVISRGYVKDLKKRMGL